MKLLIANFTFLARWALIANNAITINVPEDSSLSNTYSIYCTVTSQAGTTGDPSALYTSTSASMQLLISGNPTN